MKKKAIVRGMATYSSLVLFTAAVATLTGCAGKAARTSGGADSGSAAVGTGAGPYTASGKAGIADNLVYFDFDSHVLGSDTKNVLGAWARYLLANPNEEVRLEGHADERGSPEYNVGLGERRANAVRDELIARGVAESQLSVTSYGEDRPAVTGQGESAWRRNRRVEILD